MRIDTNFTGEAGDRELNAYNAAFYELGLRWHWDRSEERRVGKECW